LRSIKKNLLSSVTVSLTLLAIVLVTLLTHFQKQRLISATHSLVNEQISLVVKKLDHYRLVNQVDFITNTLYQLEKIEAVAIYDSDCSLLRKQPINAELKWNCDDKFINKRVIIFENKNIFSESRHSPHYILVQTVDHLFKWNDSSFLTLITIILLLIFILIILQILVVNRRVIAPVDELAKLISDTKPLQTHSNDSNFPVELSPIYNSVIKRDLYIAAANNELLANREAQTIASISQQVAHDIKSPLGSLKAALDYIDSSPAKSLKLLNASYVRICAIIKDLEKHKGNQIIQERSYLKQILSEIVAEKEIMYQFVRFQLTIDPRLEDNLSVAVINSSDIQRIVSNLINNSIEAHTNQEKLKITLTLNDQVDHLEIIVEDNGPGINKEFHHKIFQKGQSFNKKSGHGLGLYHAKQTLLATDGDISIDSNYKYGARFIINLRKYKFDTSNDNGTSHDQY
jgi:signal transduction histidine kinase